MTREQYWQAAVGKLREHFTTLGFEVPEVHVSIGFPSTRALSATKRRIGECWQGAHSKDGKPHVFLSPVVDDPGEIAAVLVHELVHALGIKGHGKDFKKVAVAVGLVGKMPATVPGEALKATLAVMLQELGPCPHVGLDAVALAKMPKQTTRQHKAVCPKCGYVARVARKWYEAKGYPKCPDEACEGAQFIGEVDEKDVDIPDEGA